MAVDRKTERLAQLATFDGVSGRALKRLATLADEVELPAGAHLSEQGHLGSQAFVVVAGTVGVERDGVEVASLGPGAVVGEVALLEHTGRNASIVARTAVDLLVFGVREFETLVADFPALGERIRAEAARRRGPEGTPA